MRDFSQQLIRSRESETSDYWNRKTQYWGGHGKPRYMQCDFETYSQADLASCGSYRYIEDASFEPLILAVAFDDEEVFDIDLAEGEDVPDAVWIALFDNEIIKTAWNAQFERTIFGRMVGRTLSPDSWRCTMVWAASLSLPLSLKNAAAVLQTGEQKDRTGENLIRFFSIPCKATNSNGGRTRNLPAHAPEEWAKFKEYCRQDVRTERDIRKKLEAFPMPAQEWDYYHMDQRINDRGVLVDQVLVQQAIECDRINSDRMTEQARRITGLKNPNSVSQLMKWLEDRGVSIVSLAKKDVAAAIAELEQQHAATDTIKMLKLRQQMAKSSVKKYQAAERCMCGDHRARGLFQFYGANRTGRFSGKSIQLQNLPQNHISTLSEARELVRLGCFELVDSVYGNTPDVLSQLIRTMLIPKPGCEFVIADYSAIEARVLSWISGERWRIKAFEEGTDIYCAAASQMFGVPVVKHGINGELRQKGKVAELSCGFGGSTAALIALGALDMGLNADELPGIINSWRTANPKIVQFWRAVEKAAIDTVYDHTAHLVGMIRFHFAANTLWISLPSGRKLAYCKPRLQPNRFGKMSVTFEGIDQNNRWTRSDTYSGKLTENITQAIARDLLTQAMWRMEHAGYDIVAHVHDEIILEVPVGSVTVDEVCAMMNQAPDWAKGLPLSSAGYIGKEYYFKD